MTTNPVIDQLRSQRDEARDTAITLAEADNFDPESESFRELEARSASLDTQIEHLAKLLDRRQAADALDGRLSKAQHRTAATEQLETRESSIGDLFVRSDVYGSYPGRGISSRVEFDVPQVRALPMTTAGWSSVITVRPPISVQAPNPRNVIIPLTTVIPVSGNAIEYVSYAKTTGGALVVAEGADKPPVEWAPTVTSKALDNIAAFTQMTRQLIEDAPAVRAPIDNELQREVAIKAEAEAVAAITGATLPTAAGPAGKGVIGAIRSGMAVVEAAGYPPNAFLIHSDDLVDADLESMTMFRGDVYWGLTPVVDPNATKGTVVVGDFRAAVHHYTRSSISLYITDSHANTFIANVFTLLAEQRSKTAVVRPVALAEATATP
jgi:HK97 family phage major capsid protein